MGFTTWTPAFTNDDSVIPATFLNQIRVDMGRAMDGNAGGTYTPSAPLILGGSGVQLAGVSNIALVSRAITRQQPLTAVPNGTDFANWEPQPYGTWMNKLTTTVLYIYLCGLPHGQRLDSVTVRYKGAAGHANDPVQLVMPTVTVGTIDNVDAFTNLGIVSDTVTGRAAYQAYHDITVAGIAHTIDLINDRYVVAVTCELAGVGAYVADAEVCQCSTVVTCTSYVEY